MGKKMPAARLQPRKPEPGEVPSRKELYSEILSIVSSNNSKPKSIYICGKPGTGKSYVVSQVTTELNRPRCRTFFRKIIEINAMELSTPAEFWNALGAHFRLKPLPLSKSMDAVLHSVRLLREKTLLVIDEFDNLLKLLNKAVLDAFSLPYANPKLVLISIANDVSLCEFLLPRLEDLRRSPEIIVFPPYKKPELVQILQRTFESHDPQKLALYGNYVEKIGDARKAIELYKNSLSSQKPPTVQALNQTVGALKELNYMQRVALIICKKLTADCPKLNILDLHKKYKRKCLVEGAEGLALDTFIDIMASLATLGVVALTGNSHSIRKKSIAVTVDWEDLRAAYTELVENLGYN